MSESFFNKIKNMPLCSNSGVKVLQRTELSDYVNSIKSRSDIFSAHLFFFQLPDKQSINILSDSMINSALDSSKLAKICEIAAKIFCLFEKRTPKLALLSANEKISTKVLSTTLCADASNILSNKENLIAEGPISFDLAISPISSQIKKYKGKIQGDADILIAPNIESASGLMQSLKYLINVPNAEILYSSDSSIAAIVDENKDWAIKIAQYIERELNKNV